jgi:hypothetical protein
MTRRLQKYCASLTSMFHSHRVITRSHLPFRHRFVLQPLLDLINEGEIALMRSPPDDEPRATLMEGRQPAVPFYQQVFDDPLMEWNNELVLSQLRGPRDVLEYCLSDFIKYYGDNDTAGYLSKLTDDIVEDMDNMRMQPAVMTSYRRFVVLRAEEEQDDPHKRYGVSASIEFY